MGNRVFGCDDCQLICPWNRYAKTTTVSDFHARHGLDNRTLLDLWQWSEDEFLSHTEGSPIRRTGYVNFLRNLAIGIGNAPFHVDNLTQLKARLGQHGDMLDEHILWAIDEQTSSRTPSPIKTPAMYSINQKHSEAIKLLVQSRMAVEQGRRMMPYKRQPNTLILLF